MASSSSENPSIGTSLGRYRIIKKLGSGGMGEVFLAEDTVLGRKVALKVLPPELTDNNERVQRFEQEARAASALNHPNILTVHEFGVENGVHFLATELVEGRTLREEIAGGELTLANALNYAEQTAFALSSAHAAGIVHRDLKPENIMIRRDGIVKLLDFGLAKLIENKPVSPDAEADTWAMVRTSPGAVMGTAAYMSPEQARGKEADGRSDIWSLGVVLYEMICGKMPFEGDSPNEVIACILKTDPALLSVVVPDVPHDLEKIVGKTLRKDRDARYQHVKDLWIDLKDLKQELEFAARLERSSPPNRIRTGVPNMRADAATQSVAAHQSTAETAVPASSATGEVHTTSSAEYIVSEIKQHKRGALAVLAGLLLGAVGLGWWFSPDRPIPVQAGQIDSIAVMPFVNASGNADVEYLSDGMTETLISSLSNIPNLSVKARSTVFYYKGKEASPKTIGEELGVQAVLLGRVVQRGDDLRLNLELVNTKTQDVIWSEQYNRKQTDLIALQTEIARDVSSKLKSKLSGTDEAKLAKTYTADPEAYQLYLKGRYYWNKRSGENLRKAIEQFTAAKDKDPNYALAYTGLADCYAISPYYGAMQSSDALPEAKSYATRALAIDEQVAEAHTSLAFINQGLWNWDEAEKEYKRAIELNPKYPTAQLWYARFQLRVLGRGEEGLARLKLAQELEPLSLVVYDNLIGTYFSQGDVNAAFEQGKRLIELDPNYWGGHYLLSFVYIKKGQNTEALAEAEKAVELANRSNRSLVGLAFALSASGKRNEALAIIKELEEKYSKRQADGTEIAGGYAGLGEKDQAFAWLEKAFQDRSMLLVELRVDNSFSPLRDDPRFNDLVRRMGMPE